MSQKALHHVHYYATPPQSPYLFFILPLSPPPLPLTSEMAISVLSTLSHLLLFSPPFRLVSPLHQVSPMKHAKNTCTFQLFVREHKCTNAGMPVGCQSDKVNDTVMLHRINRQPTFLYTTEFCVAIPSYLWILAIAKEQALRGCRFSYYDITAYTKFCNTEWFERSTLSL